MPNLTGEASVRALQHMIDQRLSRPAVDVLRYFRVGRRLFSVGNVGHMICWSTIGGPVFDPELLVSDTVDVAVLPPTRGRPAGPCGGWGLGIPDNLPQERKASLCTCSRTHVVEFEQYQVLTYKTDSNRSSTFEVPSNSSRHSSPAGRRLSAAQSKQILDYS